MDSKTLISKIQEWLHLKSKASLEGGTEPPIPAELFTADQMERYGITLALSHKLAKESSPDILLRRLSESEAILIQSCGILTQKSSAHNVFSPAKEWLLDNFYLIQEQILAIRRNLPKGYGRALPQLAGTILGYPRIYDIALQVIEHGDGRWDLENLSRFITAYQGVTKLTLGELWAVPITLGVALIENLSSASKRIVNDRNDSNLASHWADQMIEVAVGDPKKLVIVIADMARSKPVMSSAFVAELARRLQGAGLALPLSWIEQHLAGEGLTIEQVVQEENKHQAANQVTVSNSINGLRRLGEIDWRDFVETMSIVEQILREDPTATYSKMDFATRDRYRHVVERLSRISFRSEEEVSSMAIQLAKNRMDTLVRSKNKENNQDERYCHVGFYLIGSGLTQLKETLGIRRNFWQNLSYNCGQKALLCYAGSIVLITVGLTVGLLFKASQNGISHVSFWVLGILIAICSSQLALALVNLIATLLVKPQPLPKMDFSKGIPSSFSTLVVVPAMLGSISGIESLVEALEVRYLGNRDEHLYFALLTDFNDAIHAHMPEDDALLAKASAQIKALNERYSRGDADIFFLFHRAREWNESEQVWMGRERKRGKLSDLNNLLLQNIQTSFSRIVGRLGSLSNIKYVITLDSDTQLSRETARQFVGAMAHPLNIPRFDSEKQCVVEGYGILQPRVAEALPSPGPTRYVWLFGNEFGIDPYTRTVSDVYQDLFHEGSFIGKGIYDLELFQKVLGQRFPDNRILSHDLLEGCYLRSGFLSDVPLYEKSPSSYLADAKRRTRWIRGDWQLIDWLLPTVLNGEGRRVKNLLSSLSIFKLFDNIRRSLVPIALLVLLAFNWTILPENHFWLVIILAIVVLPAVVNTLLEMVQKPRDRLPSQHIFLIMQVVRRRVAQLLVYLACLPHEAGYSLAAILRTCWRMWVSKRHLLEWTPSDQVNQHLQDAPKAWFTSMWMGPASAIAAVMILIIDGRLLSLLFAIPLLTLWFTSPLIARWLSQPIQELEEKLEPTQIRFLHRMARRTWAFFDTFVTEENHWLPPDNFQEVPKEVIAKRTSPTNMGLALLANLTAYDFGYITLNQLLERTDNALQTMMNLERYHGHFYNWYDIETLLPLYPRYISTVDSGNLAGHLLTLRQGLLSIVNDPLLNIQYLNGLEDTWEVLATCFVKTNTLPVELNHFKQLLDTARLSWKNGSTVLISCQKLYELAEQIKTLHEKSGNSEISTWANLLWVQTNALFDEMKRLGTISGLTINTTLRDIVGLRSGDEQRESFQAQILLIDKLVHLAFSLAENDIDFLYDQASHLMSIGFNVDEQRCDPSYYDLLSSEARLASFVSIAAGQVQQENWFALGRQLVSNAGEPTLISWSGSMFEYLMPLLVMPTYPGTLLDQTYRAAVNRQIAYGKQKGVPWGVSESGYNAVDTQYNYLYRAFGVPGLGLKRGLEEDLVIAPYASALGLMIAPEAACRNLQRLANEQAVGRFGFYEAIDFTLSRLPHDSKKAVIRSFMAHHQGMTLLAFSYLLHNQPMQRRFVSDPLFQATLLLLQERIPKPTNSYLQISVSPIVSPTTSRPEASMRVFHTPNTRTPQIQLLSNGCYHLVLTQAGGGYSRWKEFAVTRWREDSTCDNWGLFSYVRDVTTGEFCSISFQPTRGLVDNFKTVFSEAYAEYSHRSSTLALGLHTEVVVSPEDDIELRRIRIHNHTKAHRTIEFTSYAEIVLAPQSADLSQPAFSNLFVETENLPLLHAILATRRPQDGLQSQPWLCHLLNVYSEEPYTLSFETDRARFVGRGRSAALPRAMIEKGDLSNTMGAVLDPIVAIRCRLKLEPEAFVTLDLITGIADTRSNCIALAKKYQDRRLANRIFELAWTHGQVLLHQLNISEADAQLFGRLASAIIYASNTRRADPRILASNRLGQSSLWSYSISGDLPIVLLHIEDADNIELARQLIQAQAYWRRKGLVVDLFILNEEHISYRQTLQDQIMSLITSTTTTEHAGSVVVRVADQMSLEDRILLQSVARVILSDKRGTLQEQLSRRRVSPPVMPVLNVNKFITKFVSNKLAALPNDLQFFNGLGGFTADGDEYIIRLAENVTTPAPWANVLANPNFGTLVSESGQGYTWIENAHEFRLTPWDNDPVQDSGGESYYIRDDESGLIWSPTPLPCRGRGEYQVRHGFGYSVFEHIEEGIYSELSMTVALDAGVKFILLKLRNDSTHLRRLAVTGYVAWVLGDLRAKNAMHVMTELSESGAIFAQNHYNTEFGERTAFFDATTSRLELKERTITGDRTEFIGRNGTQEKPEALRRKRLSGRVGAGLDPCAAIQLAFNLAQGESREIVFILGAGLDKLEADTLVQRYCDVTAAESALASARQYWQKTLGGLQVSTPDPAVNLLANGWLLYQVLSSRLWGRSGYYQSGGAFGFRDQLQDVMSLTHIAPDLLRAHILLCAAHQFEAGDVQHWWHPPQNRGVRTRCSDDYLWLPFVISHYIETTGDISVLDENIPFLQGRMLKVDEESYYELPTMGSKGVSLYQHAMQAIKNGLKFGEHGLPLMGSGDWNDGMNRVGIEGRGESVWLGFFLYDVLKRFIPLAEHYGDKEFAKICHEESHILKQQLETHGWDGKWYRRAYFDDGSPLGSASNTECQIDSIAQSWSVLSGAADPLRAKEAMASLYEQLVSETDAVVKLLTPPFDKSIPNPGYIEGYVPGIRENGGQYTHAAVWAAMAFAELGEKELAWQLLNILNPINHGRNASEVERYKIEPYVVAGDVYSVAPHIGRGGWSWYTGSAGWLYRLITETLLGIKLLNGNQLSLTPLLPNNWDNFRVDYRFKNTIYKITVSKVLAQGGLWLDEVQLSENVIGLKDDGQVHEVLFKVTNLDAHQL